MNPISAEPPAAVARVSFSCDRHLEEVFTGFCPSCLCERLTTLDQSSTNTPSSSRRPSSASATAAIKSFFTSTSKAANCLPPQPPPPKATKQASFFSQLRRTKSFSASRNEALGPSFEPQRKSCDVRVRTTLSTLVRLENENTSGVSDYRASPIPPSVPSSSRQHQQNIQRMEPSVVGKIVFGEKDKDEGLRASDNADKSEIVCDDYIDSNGHEIRPDSDCRLENLRNSEAGVMNIGETVVEEPSSVVNLKPMKDHIDVNAQGKKTRGGGFWAKASAFSNKWHKWRRKQKRKKENNGAKMPVERLISRHFRETQSEVAEYGFETRSWDTDPRFSLDDARISFEDARYSLDEPRASWDGYLAGRSFPKMAPMVSVMEDALAVPVPRLDMQILAKEPLVNCASEVDDGVPGGSAQTREYYSDSSSRRRKSLDRSSSTRKTAAAAAAAAATVVEIDEWKTSSNVKVSPKVADTVRERDLRDSTSHSLRDDGSEAFELGSVVMDDSNTLIGNVEKKEPKKSKKWSLRLWSFIQRLNVVNKFEEDEKHIRVDGISRSYSASWQNSTREGNRRGNGRSSVNKDMYRSSSMHWRNGNHHGGESVPGGRKQGVDTNGHGKKGKGEFVMERNMSARYFPNYVNNGLLRLYLTPLRSSRRR